MTNEPRLMYYKLQGFRPRKIQLLETALKREKICVPEKYAKRIEEFGIAKSLGTGRTKKEKKRDTGELQANLQSEVISGLSIQSRVKSDVQIEIASSSSDTQLLNKKFVFHSNLARQSCRQACSNFIAHQSIPTQPGLSS